MSREEDINAALELDEEWSDTIEARMRMVMIQRWSELVEALIAVDDPVQRLQIAEDWADEYLLPVILDDAENMTREQIAIAKRFIPGGGGNA